MPEADQSNKIPRTVSVTIGLPPEADESTIPDFDAIKDMYWMSFAEAGGQEGFDIHSNCLCVLAEATEAWLSGDSLDELNELCKRHLEAHNKPPEGET